MKQLINLPDGIGYASRLPSGDIEIKQLTNIPVVQGQNRLEHGKVLLPKETAEQLAKFILEIE